MGIPLTRRHPLNVRRRGRCRKVSGFKWFHAPNASDGEWHEKGSFHHGRRMFRRGLLDGSLLMEQGGAHVHTWPYYFSGISVPQEKFWETSYLSVRVRLQGNQENPISQATDPKKVDSVIGGVTDDSATLDC